MPKLTETERLILRPLKESDYTFLRTIHTNLEIMKYIGEGVARTEAQSREGIVRCLNIEKQNPLLGMWIAELKTTGEAIGSLIIREPATAKKIEGLEIGYSFLVHHWGKGYAQESSRGMIKYAKDQFGDVRIVALIDPANSSSRNTLTKVGFVTVGEDVYVDQTTGIQKPTEVLELKK